MHHRLSIMMTFLPLHSSIIFPYFKIVNVIMSLLSLLSRHHALRNRAVQLGPGASVVLVEAVAGEGGVEVRTPCSHRTSSGLVPKIPCWIHCRHIDPTEYGHPVHVVDHVLACCGVSPDEVGLAVIIKVGRMKQYAL